MAVKLQPIGDRIICAIERPDVWARPVLSSGGLDLPDEDRDDHLVIAVGPGRLLSSGQRAPIAVKRGDRAVFDPWRCQKFNWYEDRRQLACVAQDDLCGVIAKADSKFYPLNNLLICEQLPAERKFGMILLPAIGDDRDEAIIRMIGCGRMRDDGAIESPNLHGYHIGERILYHKRMGRHFYLDGKQYVAMEPRFVFCVIDDADIMTLSEVAEA